MGEKCVNMDCLEDGSFDKFDSVIRYRNGSIVFFGSRILNRIKLKKTSSNYFSSR